VGPLSGARKSPQCCWPRSGLAEEALGPQGGGGAEMLGQNSSGGANNSLFIQKGSHFTSHRPRGHFWGGGNTKVAVHKVEGKNCLCSKAPYVKTGCIPMEGVTPRRAGARPVGQLRTPGPGTAPGPRIVWAEMASLVDLSTFRSSRSKPECGGVRMLERILSQNAKCQKTKHTCRPIRISNSAIAKRNRICTLKLQRRDPGCGDP